MAPIAARQSELCGESREITIPRTVCARACVYIYTYTVYIHIQYIRVCVHILYVVSIMCACVCPCYMVTLMMMDDVVLYLWCKYKAHVMDPLDQPEAESWEG